MLELKGSGNMAEIVVGDSGGGSSVAERDKVGQRFYRLESSRSTPASGLGLSLARAAARLHRAALLLGDDAPGLKATLRLPLGTD